MHMDDVTMILWTARAALANIAYAVSKSWASIITNGLKIERSDKSVVLPDGPAAQAAKQGMLQRGVNTTIANTGGAWASTPEPEGPDSPEPEGNKPSPASTAPRT